MVCTNAPKQEAALHTLSILANRLDGVLTINKWGGMESANKAAIKLFGYSADEMLGQSVAKVGYERIQEMADPALSLDRARQTWQQHGRSAKWIQQRMTGQETRSKLTDYWSEHDIKEMKSLKSHNLRDYMSETELIFTALAELSTRQIAENVDANGMPQNQLGSIPRRPYRLSY